MWLDRSRGKNAYEVPKGSGNTLVYIGALWMGGMDVNNQLKIAALRYRIGNDFWAGPLSTNPGTGDITNGKLDYGPAEIDADDCSKWDQFFITKRSEVELFNAWYECSTDPNCDANFEYPNYQIPESILEWGNATHGNLTKNQDFYLAPYNADKLDPVIPFDKIIHFGREPLINSHITKHGVWFTELSFDGALPYQTNPPADAVERGAGAIRDLAATARPHVLTFVYKWCATQMLKVAGCDASTLRYGMNILDQEVADAAFSGAAPHPFVMAEQALRALDRDRASQSFVISGESGSGKTETCKFILRYLSYRSKRRFELAGTPRGGANALEESVLLSNPVLEAFGNAKTLRNDNSSRWGKYTQVYVEPSSGAIKSVGITAYLLEKVRVVERARGERNYHVLHQLVAGAKKQKKGDAGLALAVGLGEAQTSHAVLRDTATSSAAIGVDDAAQFAVTRDALRKLDVAQPGLFGALAAVCHLGDVCFEEVEAEGQDAAAAIASQDLRMGRKAEHAADAAARA